MIHVLPEFHIVRRRDDMRVATIDKTTAIDGLCRVTVIGKRSGQQDLGSVPTCDKFSMHILLQGVQLQTAISLMR
jgi:hypothetical protein